VIGRGSPQPGPTDSRFLSAIHPKAQSERQQLSGNMSGARIADAWSSSD
jgi:hypothetical protein